MADVSIAPLDCHSVTKLVFGPSDAQKKILITVCIHGDEVCGLQAVNKLVQEGFFRDDLIDLNVRVTIMMGNPLAVMKNKRFIDRNLNRMFIPQFYSKEAPHTKEPYEYSRLQEIISEMHNCDSYLDIHSTSAPTKPFAIIGPGEISEVLAKKLPVKFILHNVHQAIAGTSIDYTKQLHIPSVCIECGQHISEEAVQIAKESIQSFIIGNRSNSLPKKILFVHQSVILKEGFKYERHCKAFDYVKYGELLASDKEGEIRCPYKQGAFLIMPVANPVLGEEAWLWGHTHFEYTEMNEVIDNQSQYPN